MTGRSWMAALVFLTACSGGDGGGRGGGGGGWGGKGGASAEPVTVVEVDEVVSGSVAQVLVSSAVVESERAADLLPQATGVVRQVLVDEGDVVQKGQLLATFENVTLDAGAERARAEVDKLARDARTSRELFGKGAISQKELSEAEYQLATAESRLKEARGSAGQTAIRSPFFGVVASRDVRVGQLASSGQKAFTVVDPARLRVVVQLPERDLAQVTTGQTAVLVSAYDPNVKANGHVSRIAPVVDPTSGTFRVHIAVDDGAVLRPGQFVSINLEVDRHEDVVVVQRRAVVYEDGLPVIYRMIEKPEEEPKEGDDDGEGDDKGDKKGEGKADDAGWFAKLFGGGESEDDAEGEGDEASEEPPQAYVSERVRLKLGLVDDTLAEVTEGVEIGDQVVVVGQANLRDGAAVKTPAMIAEEEKSKAAKEEKAKADGDDKAEEKG